MTTNNDNGDNNLIIVITVTTKLKAKLACSNCADKAYQIYKHSHQNLQRHIISI